MNPAQASSTAKLIAASTILLASEPAGIAQVAPGAAAICRVLLSTTRCDRLMAASAGFAPTRAMWRLAERLVMPGIIEHYWHRKRWIEAACRAAIGGGYTHVLVIGAGFDTMGLRLAQEFPEVKFTEADHPATQAVKLTALAGGCAGRPENLRFIALDLEQGLPRDLLDEAGISSFVVIEGVLMYLPPARVGSLLTALAAQRPGRCRIVFTFMTQWPDGMTGFRPRSRLVEFWLSRRQEPFNWSLAPTAMEQFLNKHQLRLLRMVVCRQLPGEAGGPLDGENIVECEVLT